MHRISAERTIAAPPEQVFAAATDVHRFAEIVPAILKVEVQTPGPMALGTRLGETRKLFGSSATEEMTVTAFDPPRSYVVGAESHGCRYRTEFRFERQGDGTRMVMDFGAEPLTLAAKAMSVLMKPMTKKMVDLLAQDLEAIKAHCEARP